MAEKLERKVMEIYGENAATRDIIAYGSDIAGNIVETKDPDVIQTEAYKTGVRSAVVGNNSTTLQNRQALDFLFSRQLKYIYQNGIPEWGADETYYQFSVVRGSDGNLYGSITDNNVGHNPVQDTEGTYWRHFPTYQELDAKVNKSGDTMTGTLINRAGFSAVQSNLPFNPTTPPSSNITGTGFNLADSTGSITNLGYFSNQWKPSGALLTRIGVNRKDANDGNHYGEIAVECDSQNIFRGRAPTPPSSDNENSIATTQWIRQLLGDFAVSSSSTKEGIYWTVYKSTRMTMYGKQELVGNQGYIDVTFPKAFTDAPYVMVTPFQNTSSGFNHMVAPILMIDQTNTTSFRVSYRRSNSDASYIGGFFWIAFGHTTV